MCPCPGWEMQDKEDQWIKAQQIVAQKRSPRAILMCKRCNLLYFCVGLLIFLHFLLQFAKNVLILRRLRANIIKNVRLPRLRASIQEESEKTYSDDQNEARATQKLI